MKSVFTFSMCFVFAFSVFAQQNMDELKRAEKDLIKKAVYSEIIDIGGELHKGWLWYADSTELVISNKVLNPDTLTILSYQYIYKMKLKVKDRYGKRFLHHFIATTVIAAAGTVVSLIGGEDMMVGAGFIFAVLSFAYGLPTAVLTAFIPYKYNRNYTCDSQKGGFLKAYRLMQKKKISTGENDSCFIKTPQPERNPSKLLLAG